MIAQELETALSAAFIDARSKRHEFITVEHLLLALLDTRAVADVLRACSANLDELRSHLAAHTMQHTPVVAAEREVNTQPTLGFQRTMQRAILRVQASNKKEVSGADVLVAIFGEHDSHAVYFLDQQGIGRFEVTRRLSHGEFAADDLDLYAPEMRQVVIYQDQALPAGTTEKVLEDFVLMQGEELTEVISELARQGKAVCGLYPRETAEFLVEQIRAYALKHRLPLRCEATVQVSRLDTAGEK